jgi:hypothetical protein
LILYNTHNPEYWAEHQFTGELTMQEVKVKTAVMLEIDQYGRSVEIIKEHTKIKDGCKKTIDAIISKLPEDSLQLTGKEFELLITAPAEKTVVTDNKKVLQELGIDKFLELAQFSIEDLKKWLNPEQLTAVTTKVKGNRTFRSKRKLKETKPSTKSATVLTA